MTNKPITELDFAEIKRELKEFLSSQDKFKDYDFQGSNMSVLLDVLAYNTFMNNYYTNMAISESFLDSAQIRNSIVSHAKSLNYLPNSMKSSGAMVNLTVTTNTDSEFIIIPKEASFTSSKGSFVFRTDKAVSANRISANTYSVEDVMIYEGGYYTDTFVAKSGMNSYVITNKNVDIDSVSVTVDGNEYVRRTNIYGIESDQKVYYIEPHFDDYYEITFGLDNFGRQPLSGEVISVNYRVSSGEAANGITKFQYDRGIPDSVNVTVSTVSPSRDGAKRESNENIKRNAPKSIQVQDRAVTERDYENLLKMKYSEIQSISAYGGETITPPMYGKVIVSVDITGLDGITELKINEYEKFLKNKMPLSIRPMVKPAEFVYVDTDATVYIDTTKTDKSVSQIRSNILNLLLAYGTANLNTFEITLYSSEIEKYLSTNEPAVRGIFVGIQPILTFVPNLNVSDTITLDFGNALKKSYKFVASNGFENYSPAIKSSFFTYQGGNCYLQDNGDGVMQVVEVSDSGTSITEPNIGTVNYDSGIVRLVGFNVSNFVGDAIEVFAVTKEDKINSPKGKIMRFRSTDLMVNVKEASR